MSAAVIDPSARIDAAAVIGSDVSVGPYCTVGPHVTLGDGCQLLAHVNVTGHTTIGTRTVDPTLRLARLAAAIGALSRRADAARRRHRLRYS